MRTRLVLLLAAMLSTSVIAGGALTVNPEAILKDINENGAKATVQKLTGGKHPQWNSVLRKIESGDARWLAVTRQLAAGTDAGTSEDLQVILARALPKNPAGVLGLADSQTFLAIDDLCGAPFIEPEPAYLHRYLAKAQAAVKKLNDASVEEQRKKCLARIEKTIAEEASKTPAASIR
jgi:hypothetical protein